MEVTSCTKHLEQSNDLRKNCTGPVKFNVFFVFLLTVILAKFYIWKRDQQLGQYQSKLNTFPIFPNYLRSSLCSIYQVPFCLVRIAPVIRSSKVPKYYDQYHSLDSIRNLQVDGCQSNLHVMLKQLLFFTNFTTSFVGGIL